MNNEHKKKAEVLLISYPVFTNTMATVSLSSIPAPPPASPQASQRKVSKDNRHSRDDTSNLLDNVDDVPN